jgi:hypothetical protein
MGGTPTSNLLSFITNSTAQMVINSSGSVGIGTTSPNANALLQLYSTSKGFLPPLLTTANETAMGTALPTGLVVYNTTNNELESFNGTAWEAVGASSLDAGGTNTQLQYNNNGDLGGTAGLTWDSTNDALTLATIANPAASALTLTGGTAQTASYPALNITQTWNNASTNFTGIKENITNTASIGTSKLLDLQIGGTSAFNVTGAGYVGIGTTSPAAPLTVASGSASMQVTPGWFSGTGTWINLDTSGPSGIGSGGAGANPWVAYVASASNWFSGSAVGDIAYRNTGGRLLFGTSTGSPTMVISGSNVGIGTTNPTQALQVSGNVLLSSGSSLESYDLSTPANSIHMISMNGGNYIHVGDSNRTIYLDSGASNSTIMSGSVGIGSTSPLVSLDMSQKGDALALPVGTSGSRPTGTALVNGEIRYNSAIPGLEAYVNGAWSNILASTVGTSSVTGAGTTNYVARWTAGTNLGTGTLYDNGTSVGIGTTAPVGKLSVVSSDTGTTTSNVGTLAWSSNYTVFGPNAGSTTGAALGLGYSSTGDLANITSLAPSVAWKPLVFGASSFSFLANGATQGLYQNSSGNVGIGTASPQAPLHVYGSGTTAAAIKITDSNSTGIEIRSTNNGVQYIDFTPNSTSEATYGTPDYSGRIAYNLVSNGFSFYTSASSTSSMTLLSTGAVGIGTTAPLTTLDVQTASNGPASSGNVNSGVVITQSGGTGPSLNMGNYASGSTYYAWIQSAFHNNAGVTEPLALQPVGGNVGIGTTSPGAVLQVGGLVGAGGTGALSSVLRAFSQTSLSSTATSDLPLASIGFDSNGNNVSLGIHGYRASAGSTWTTSAIGLGMDVDNTTRAGANIWLNANGNVGIGSTSPQTALDVGGAIHTSAVVETTVGSAIASASTIAPVTGLFHVTGTAAISTITPPTGMSSSIGGCVIMIADGMWSTTTSGNIYSAMTATVGIPYNACYDGSKWYIK